MEFGSGQKLFSFSTSAVRYVITLIGVLFVIGLPCPLRCEEILEDAKHSDYLVPLIVSTEASLAADKDRGSYKAWKCGLALASTFAVVNCVKAAFKNNRPDGSGADSFPSGHAALAFTSASVINTSQPNRALPAYLAAAYISWSRVEYRRHFWRDVLAGALIGQVIGKQFAVKNKASAPLFSLSVTF